MMNDIQPNSHRFKEEQRVAASEKKIEKVVTGTVKTRKKPAAKKLSDIFISEDVANVKSYIFMDVLVPAIKKAISDIVTDGIEMILYGGTSSRDKKRPGSSKVSYVSYDKYADRRDDRRYVGSDSRNRFDYDEIVFENRGQAEAVLNQMFDVIEQYNVVSVLDLYDMVDMSAPHTANKYGWTNLRNADVVRVRDGYIIKLPKPFPID